MKGYGTSVIYSLLNFLHTKHFCTDITLIVEPCSMFSPMEPLPDWGTSLMRCICSLPGYCPCVGLHRKAFILYNVIVYWGKFKHPLQSHSLLRRHTSNPLAHSYQGTKASGLELQPFATVRPSLYFLLQFLSLRKEKLHRDSTRTACNLSLAEALLYRTHPVKE